MSKRNRRFHKARRLALAAVTALLLLAGCTGGAGSETPTDPGPTSEGASRQDGEQQAGEPAGDGETIAGTISMWTWTEESMRDNIVPGFNALYPDVTVEHSAINMLDVPDKLQTVIASGAQPPDVIWAERTVMGKLVSLDCWEDLRDYGVRVEDILDVMLPLCTNARGEIVGLDMAPGFTGLAYKRALALEYLGTDDPAELEALLPTWDAFYEQGKAVLEQSGGAVYMVPGVGALYHIMAAQDGTPYTDGDTLQVRRILTPIFQRLVEATQLGIANKHMNDTPAYNASIAGSTDLFYPCATYSPFYTIKPNDPDENNTWGLIENPEGGTMTGGTLMCVINSSPNKEAAAAFVKYYALSYEGSVMKRDKGISPSTSLKSVYDDPGFYSRQDPVFGNQDIDRKFGEIALNMCPIRPYNDYDPEISQAINVAIMTINSSVDGNVDVADLVTQVEEEILSKVPGLTR